MGLMGSGRQPNSSARSSGLDKIDAARPIFQNGAPQRSPPELLRHCGYITESSHADGLFLNQPVWKNISVTALGRFASTMLDPIGHPEGDRASTDRYIELLRIMTPGHDLHIPCEGLSGGNQQKVVFGKWLSRKAPILVMDEPTRGVDVGAKLEISNLIKELAREGTAILLITSEVEEMVSLGDRVLVLREGSIVADLEGADINNATLMELALGAETLQ